MLDDQLRGDVDPVMEALRDLVEQIEGAGFVSRVGEPIENLIAFVEARELVRGYSVNRRY